MGNHEGFTIRVGKIQEVNNSLISYSKLTLSMYKNLLTPCILYTILILRILFMLKY